MAKKAKPEPAVKPRKPDLISPAPPRRGSTVKGKLPPLVEEGRKEARRDPGRCKNCGREGTLTTKIVCTDCGFSQPA